MRYSDASEKLISIMREDIFEPDGTEWTTIAPREFESIKCVLRIMLPISTNGNFGAMTRPKFVVSTLLQSTVGVSGDDQIEVRQIMVGSGEPRINAEISRVSGATE